MESGGGFPSGTGTVERLHVLLDEMVDEDAAVLTDHELTERVLGVARARCRLEYVHLETLSVWDSRGVYADDGSRSGASRIAAQTGFSRSEAAAAIRRARRLRSLPATAEAISAGVLDPRCAELLSEASTIELDVPFTEVEPILVEACATVGFDEAKAVISRWVRAHDRAGDEERERRSHDRRHLSIAETLEGQVHINGLLPAVAGREFAAEVRRLEKQLRDDDRRTGSLRTAQQRRADALALMARRSATLDIDETVAGRSPRVLLSVVVGLNTVESLCETLAGSPLPTGELVPLLERADIERLVFDGPDTVVTVSRQRTFTGALRRAIEVRDGRCTHPSVCDTPAEHCDGGHVIDAARGGPTSQANGGMECEPHNRIEELHRRAPRPGEWRVWRPPRGWIPDTS